MSDISFSDIRRLDGALLLVFREVLRARRTTIAAERLGVTQSTVSHALDRLRDIFGDPLFVRRPHGVEPTRRALELGPRIEALIDLTAQTLRSGDGAFDPRRSERRFNLAAPENVTTVLGAGLLNRLKAAAPGVSFSVQYLLANTAVDALRRGEVDLALGRLPSNLPGIVSETLYTDHYCVVARKDHPQINGALSDAEYVRIGHITIFDPPEGGPEDSAPDPRLVNTPAFLPKWLAALTMVAASDAIASCPRRLADRLAGPLGLQVIEMNWDGPGFPIHCLRLAGRPDPGLDWFTAQVRGAAGHEALDGPALPSA